MTSPSVASPTPPADQVAGDNSAQMPAPLTPLPENGQDPTINSGTPALITPTKPKTEAMATPAPKSAPPKLAEEASPPTETTTLPCDADLILGELVAEGGFCSIWEITGVHNLDNGKWLLKPPPPTTPGHKSHGHGHKRGGSSAFGSLGLGKSNRKLGSGGHKRGASMSNLMHSPRHDNLSLLPPLMKSVQLTVVTPFEVHKAASALAAASAAASPRNSLTGGTPVKKSSMRRSQSRDSLTTPTPKKGGLLRRSTTKDTIPTSTPGQPQMPQGAPYVMKCLKPQVFGTPKVLDMGLKDMKIEIEMLQQLEHPNIITVLAHGTMILEAIPVLPKKQLSRGPDPTQVAYPFVILDRLGETLEHKLAYWEAKHEKKTTLVGKLVTNRGFRKDNFAAHERWSVLRDMASALAYMHSQRIVYRDLKPENVAFDRYSDQLKLIDLGLAKDLKPLTPTKATGLYRLTALTGSARYMAPEVAREDEYNERCDVYGMAICIWQVMSLQTPYAKFNVQKMFQVVYDCPHSRPSLVEWKEDPNYNNDDEHSSSSMRWLVKLLNKMWSPLIEERPSMKEVYAILKRQVQKVEMEQSMATSV